LLNLPVNVIVKLAEKKVELGQLTGLGPGAIVTFEKSCEDLLDLYVNNQLYCRGEAVKIGEKFGIKITEIGAVEERISAVLHSQGR
jgi:flagellar motor switch protein FliN/FliY